MSADVGGWPRSTICIVAMSIDNNAYSLACAFYWPRYLSRLRSLLCIYGRLIAMSPARIPRSRQLFIVSNTMPTPSSIPPVPPYDPSTARITCWKCAEVSTESSFRTVSRLRRTGLCIPCASVVGFVLQDSATSTHCNSHHMTSNPVTA